MKLLIFLGLLMMTMAVHCSYHSQISDTQIADTEITDTEISDNEANETDDRSGGNHHTDCGFIDPDHDCIPGIGGVNYGNLHYPPGHTHFQCTNRAPGYYADPHYFCQVFYICDPNHIKYYFICPPGQAFNQELLTCVYYESYDCSSAPSHYDDPQNVFGSGCLALNADTAVPEPEKKNPPQISTIVTFLAHNAKAQPQPHLIHDPPKPQTNLVNDPPTPYYGN